MRKTIWSIFLGACAMLMLSVACDRTPTSLQEELNEEMSDETVTFIRKRSGVEEVSRAKRNANSHEESPYSCRVSTLNGDDAEYNYDNRSFWIHFPEAAIKEANGNTVFKALTLTDKHAGSRAGHWNGVDDVVRVAQCVIPDSELAERLLENELKKFGKGTWLESRMKLPNQLNMVQSVTSGGEWVCVREMTIFICEADPDTGELIHCVQYVHSPVCIEYAYVENDDPGSGGGPGDGSDNPGYCDPTGIEPCFDDGGSSVPPPEPDPCKDHPEGDPDRPVYCDKPCDETDDEIIKLLSESQVLENLWMESFGAFINGNPPPQAERKEMGGWLVEENGQQSFVYFPEETTSSFCSINNVPPPPPGAVAVIHTHPIYPDERIKVECYLEMFFELYNITDPVEKAEYYESGIRPGTGASNADKEYAKKYKISAYYMDGENVEKFYDGTIEQEVKEKEERCGY